MANAAERKLREHLKRVYPEAWIKKVPDFKQTGTAGGRGLPDYLCVCDGFTDWYEVKLVKSATLFPFAALSEVQWSEFSRMTDAGAVIWIAAVMRNRLCIFSFKRLRVLYLEHRVKSVLVAELV